MTLTVFLVGILCLASFTTATECVITATRFRTNHLVNPLALADAKPRFSYALSLIDGVSPSPTDHFQSAYRIECTNDLTGDILWDSGKVYSNETLEIEYAGKRLKSLTRVSWTVQVWDESGQLCDQSNYESTEAWFESGLLDEKAWGGAEWIARYGALSPSASLCSLMAKNEENKVPRFRTTVNIPTMEKFVHVRAYIVGLGYYQLYIEGQKVGDALLDPAWTTYSKRVLYAAHDVTDMVLNHANRKITVGVELGNGEWNPLPMLFWEHLNIRQHLVNEQGHPSTRPMFRLHMVGVRADGSNVSLLRSDTASSWRAGGSPTVFNNIYLGEKHDARLEPFFQGWNTVAFKETNQGHWAPPVRADASGLGKLEAQAVPPIRKQRTLTATMISIRQGEDDQNQVVLMDTNLNHAGTCRIQFQHSRGFANFEGSAIQFRYGESLTDDGELNPLTSVAGAIYKHNPNAPCQPDTAYQQDLLILGSNSVDWTPSWSWHGFRYIEATLPQAVHPGDLTLECFTMRTDVAVISKFTSSDPWLSKLRDTVQNTFESNLMGIQTGCPHRERLGYGGDALGSGEAAMSIYDFSAFYRKRVLDYNDGQRLDPHTKKLTGFTETSPYVGIADGGIVKGGTGPIGWELFQPEAQLWLYKYYGDTQTMRDSLANTAAFINLLDNEPEGIERGLGDWLAVYATDVRYSGRGFQRMAYLDYSNITEILGLPLSIARSYRRKAARLASMINERFQDGDGAFRVGTGGRAGNVTQTGQALALFTGFVDGERMNRTLEHMVEEIKSSSYIQGACHAQLFKATCPMSRGGPGPHLTAGMMGIKWVLMALADGGKNDLAYDIIATKTYPSFRWMTENPFANATTLWESYYYSDRKSQNHPMFGGSLVWLFQSVAGIQPHPSSRGMDHVLIRPNPPSQLDHAAASFQTPRGVVRVSWKKDSLKKFRLTTLIPPNCRATVSVPAKRSCMIVHNGVTKRGRWVPSGNTINRGTMVFEIRSGLHLFLSHDCYDDTV